MPLNSRRCKRCAFVLGNSAYRHAPPLKNPPNDVAAIVAELKAIKYNVFEHQDRDFDNINRHFDDFVAATESAGTILIYYSGHGLQLPDEQGNIINYIVTIDFTFECDNPVARLVPVQPMIERI